MFFRHKLNANYRGEVGSDFSARIQGSLPEQAPVHPWTDQEGRQHPHSFTKVGRRVVISVLVIRECFVQTSLVRNAL
jgi:hypothetical protein